MAYANGTNAPFGLQPRQNLLSTTPTGQQGEYLIASGYATSLFDGDRVTRLADGTIGIAPAGTPAIGVFKQVKYVDTLGNPQISTYWPASTATLQALPALAYIVDDYTIEFDVQVSNSLNVANPSITTAQLGLNANLAVGGGGNLLVPQNPTSGNTRSGISAYYLDFSTIDSDSTLDVKIVRFSPYVGNVSGVPFNNVIVTLNNDLYKSTGVGIVNDFGKITSVTTTPYTVLLSDETLAVDTSIARSIVLPTAATTNKNKKYIIKDISGSAGANNITISVTGGGNIDGAATLVISSNYGKATVVNTGTHWFTI